MPDLAQADAWVIEPRPGGFSARVQEVWRYRRMFAFFAHRAFLKLYQRTILGRAWVVLRPLLPLVVRVLLFGGLLNLGDATGVPYFLYVAVGSAAWELFAAALMWATRSLELNGGILSRLYVPRLILPVATMAPALVYFAVHVAVIAATLVYYRMQDGVWYLSGDWLVVAPVAILLILLFAVAIGLWTSVLGAGARDVRFGLGYVLEFWVYLTPVVYPLAIVPQQAQSAVMLNPMAVFVVAFRGAVLGGEGPTPRQWTIACLVVAAVLVAGLVFFTRAEAEAVDSL